MWKYGLIVSGNTVALHEFYDDDGDGDFQASYTMEPTTFEGVSKDEIISSLLDAVRDLASDEAVMKDG